MPFPTAPQVNLPACSSHCPFDAERQARSCEYLFEVIGLIQLGIKPKSTTAEADALGTLIWFICTKPNQNGGHPDSNNETCLIHVFESLTTVNVSWTSRVFLPQQMDFAFGIMYVVFLTRLGFLVFQRTGAFLSLVQAGV